MSNREFLQSRREAEYPVFHQGPESAAAGPLRLTAARALTLRR
jgi:hypothetical protein